MCAVLRAGHVWVIKRRHRLLYVGGLSGLGPFFSSLCAFNGVTQKARVIGKTAKTVQREKKICQLLEMGPTCRVLYVLYPPPPLCNTNVPPPVLDWLMFVAQSFATQLKRLSIALSAHLTDANPMRAPAVSKQMTFSNFQHPNFYISIIEIYQLSNEMKWNECHSNTWKSWLDLKLKMVKWVKVKSHSKKRKWISQAIYNLEVFSLRVLLKTRITRVDANTKFFGTGCLFFFVS